MAASVVRDSDQAREAIAQFGGYLKLASWLYLHTFGLNTLPGVIVPEWTARTRSTLLAFAEQMNVDELLIRSDKEAETGDYPRGGYTVPVGELEGEARRFLSMDRLPYFLLPKSAFDDLYSISCGLWGDRVLIEIVGPGFDASDLKRGDASPHEWYTMHMDQGSIESIKEHGVTTLEGYRASWEERVLKIGRSLVAGRRISSSALRELAKDELSKRGETMIFENEQDYVPIPQKLLGRVVDDFELLVEQLEASQLPSEPVVLSMSFVSRRGTPIYWDFIWPGRKFVPVTT